MAALRGFPSTISAAIEFSGDNAEKEYRVSKRWWYRKGTFNILPVRWPANGTLSFRKNIDAI